MTPGCSLPLLVSNSRAHWALEQALSAPAPLTGLLAVVRLLSSAGLGAWSALSCPVYMIWPLLMTKSCMHRSPKQTCTLHPFLSQTSWQSVSSSSLWRLLFASWHLKVKGRGTGCKEREL